MIKKICEFLIANGAKEEKREIYEYALNCLLNEVGVDIILLITAIFLGMFKEMSIWICVFNSLRMNIGGYHAKTQKRCVLFSVALGLFSVMIGRNLQLHMVIVFIIVFFLSILIFRIAPIVHPNRPIGIYQQEKAKRRALRFMFFWSVIGIVMYRRWIPGVMCGIMAELGAVGLMLLESPFAKKLVMLLYNKK